jgi:hypothetical protein
VAGRIATREARRIMGRMDSSARTAVEPSRRCGVVHRGMRFTRHPDKPYAYSVAYSASPADAAGGRTVADRLRST